MKKTLLGLVLSTALLALPGCSSLTGCDIPEQKELHLFNDDPGEGFESFIRRVTETRDRLERDGWSCSQSGGIVAFQAGGYGSVVNIHCTKC